MMKLHWLGGSWNSKRKDHGVDPHGLSGAGRARDQQVRHPRKVGDDGSPPMVLPSASGSAAWDSERRRLQHVPGCTTFPASGLAARCRWRRGPANRNTRRNRTHGAGDIVGSSHAGRFRPAPGLQLEQRDDRARVDPGYASLDAEIAEIPHQGVGALHRPWVEGIQCPAPLRHGG